MSVGIDIGSRSIKVVELGKSGNGFQLKGAGAVGYPGISIDVKTAEDDLAQAATVIKKLFRDVRIQSTNVTLALPESSVFTRVLKFPLLTDNEVANAVKYEAEDYLPIPIEDAVVEYQIIERQEKSNPPKVLVLLTATTKTVVDKYVQIAKMAGLTVDAVETSLIGSVRSSTPKDRNSLLVDIGASATEIAVSRMGQLYFTRTIPTAGDAFTRGIAQAFNVHAAQAEQYKQTYGFDDQQLDGKVKLAMQPVLGIITEEIRKTIHFYEMDTHSDSPSTIVVAGASASVPHLVKAISEAINVEVTLANPFKDISMDDDSRRNMAPYAHVYAVAAGLAMRS